MSKGMVKVLPKRVMKVLPKVGLSWLNKNSIDLQEET